MMHHLSSTRGLAAVALISMGCHDYGFGAPSDAQDGECFDIVIPGEDLDVDLLCLAEEADSDIHNVITLMKQEWSVNPQANSVVSVPLLLRVADENGDGTIDDDDIPALVVQAHQPEHGLIHAFSGVDGTEYWSVETHLQPHGGLAGGDLDGDGLPEIVGIAIDGAILCWDHNGEQLWRTPGLGDAIAEDANYPAIADMDGDGRPEITVGSAILDADGNLLGAGAHGIGGTLGSVSLVADLDLDGQQELVVGNAAYDISGQALWTSDTGDGYPAVADLDLDGLGEVVVSDAGGVTLLDTDGTLIWRIQLEDAENSGPPTIIDVDGDELPEIAVASDVALHLLDASGGIVWEVVTNDPSGTTSSTAFDFEADGLPELVYADQEIIYLLSGLTGEERMKSYNRGSSTWLEYPLVVDVDADDEAELVVGNAAFDQWASQWGVTVFDALEEPWLPAREIWNQHSWSVTNIEDDASIPANPEPNWETYNSFRAAHLNPTMGLMRPDLVVTLDDVCTYECDDDYVAVWVRVGNQGLRDVHKPVEVTVYGVLEDGDRVPVGATVIDDSIPAGALLDAVRVDTWGCDTSQVVDLEAVVDVDPDGEGDGAHLECDETNNESTWGRSVCH